MVFQCNMGTTLHWQCIIDQNFIFQKCWEVFHLDLHYWFTLTHRFQISGQHSTFFFLQWLQGLNQSCSQTFVSDSKCFDMHGFGAMRLAFQNQFLSLSVGWFLKNKCRQICSAETNNENIFVFRCQENLYCSKRRNKPTWPNNKLTWAKRSRLKQMLRTSTTHSEQNF